MINIGNGYNKWFGYFIVFIKGFYVFLCMVMVESEYYIVVMMVKNGYVMVYIYLNFIVWEIGVILVVLVLKKGDKVWIW